jgi:hypothetical protein
VILRETGELRQSAGPGLARFGSVFEAEPFVEVARLAGENPTSVLIQAARRSDVMAGVYPIRDLSGTAYFHPINQAIEILFASTNDSAAGTGAQKVMLDLISPQGVQSIVEYATGATGANHIVAVTGTWGRINRAWVSQAGSNKANVGNITIRNVGGAETYSRIPGSNDSAIAPELRYTVPVGKVAILEKIRISGQAVVAHAIWLRTNQDPQGVVHDDEDGDPVYYWYRTFITANTSEDSGDSRRTGWPVRFNARADIEIFFETFSATALTVVGSLGLTVWNATP